MNAHPEYAKRLVELVRRAVVLGAGDFRDVCVRARGADPTNVAVALQTAGFSPDDLARTRREAVVKAARARRAASDLLAELPGANIDDSQWWFSLDCIERVSELIFDASGATECIHFGAATLAPYYRMRFDASCLVLDIDDDVVAAVNAMPGMSGCARAYDVSGELPTFGPGPRVAVMDPPWYEVQTKLFLARASQAVPLGGKVFSTIPGELTRPTAQPEREKFAAWATGAGLKIEDIRSGFVEYSVPDFERTAFRSFERIQARPWRYADLATLEKVAEPKDVPVVQPARRPVRYFRGPKKKLRVFLHPDRVMPALDEQVVFVQEASTTVSARVVDRSTIALWTSTNSAFRVRDFAVATSALEAWQGSVSQGAALEAVRGRDAATLLLTTLFKHLVLPDSSESARRTPEQIAKHRREALSEWAEPEPADPSGDGYRNRFARDRDRVLWSTGIRQLANKTQVFSTRESDHVRQRLTHSTEVMQLASTVGTSFGLDRDLIEAGALAHDIGHTPFGHAGEAALSRSLGVVSKEVLSFNHYEHGVDVVVWLEDLYRHPSNGEKFGLELSGPVLESIFKHAFRYDDQVRFRANSKHKDLLRDGPCHLEGQAIRAADKISYLISDIEDGLRLGAISLDDLRACSLFAHPPIDLTHQVDGSPLAAFIAQRRSIISVLMEDLIDETARRLARLGDRRDVVRGSGHTVDHSDTIRAEMKEVWDRVQAGKLHHDARVVAANRRAAKIISRLFMLYSVRPALVDPGFRAVHAGLRKTGYLDWYRAATANAGVRIPADVMQELALELAIDHDDAKQMTVEDVIMAKDYVASMTDQRATRVFRELFGQD